MSDIEGGIAGVGIKIHGIIGKPLSLKESSIFTQHDS